MDVDDDSFYICIYGYSQSYGEFTTLHTLFSEM